MGFVLNTNPYFLYESVACVLKCPDISIFVHNDSNKMIALCT